MLLLDVNQETSTYKARCLLLPIGHGMQLVEHYALISRDMFSILVVGCEFAICYQSIISVNSLTVASGPYIPGETSLV